jgi:hypothetical protein
MSPMRRLLAFIIIFTLLLGQGFSAGAAMCVHRSVQEHADALESRDGTVAAVAVNEDSAAALVAKKAASAGANGPSIVAHLVPPPVIVPPRHVSDRVNPSFADGPALESISIAPLLRPPHA